MLLAACAGVALPWALGAASADAASGVYVAETGTNMISQFGVALDGALTPMIPGAVAAGKFPYAIAISPDAKSVYVTNADEGDVSQYDVGPGGALSPKSPATVALPAGADPNSIAVSPDGRSVYVSSEKVEKLAQFDVGANGVLIPKSPATVPAPYYSSGLAVSPDERSVYVTDFGGDVVWQYDIGPGGLLSAKSPATVPAGNSPSEIAITPDGQSVYVSDVNGYELSQYDVGPGGTLSPKTPTTVNSGHFPRGIAISPDGRYVYVAEESGSVIEQYGVGPGGALSLLSEAPTAKEGPQGLAMSPDGKSVYTTLYYGNLVSQYDVGAGGALSPKSPATVATEENPAGIAVLPDSGPLASFAATAADAGAASAFSSSSSGPYPIARYDWSFGDGTSAPNGGPSPTHVFAAPGTYTVVLQVTDAAGCSHGEIYTGQVTYCNGNAGAITSATITVPPAPILGTLPRPVVSGARQSASRWREGRLLARISARRKPPIGTVFSFDLNERAAVRLAFTSQLPGRRVGSRCVAKTRRNRHRRACRRTVVTGVLSFTGHSGTNKVAFQGRITGSRRLRPGRHTVTITATNAAGARSAPVSLRFLITG